MNTTSPEKLSGPQPPISAKPVFLGRAIVLVLAILGIAMLGAWLVRRYSLMRGAESQTPVTATSPGSAEIPEAKFTDITSQSGIQFVHYNGAYGDKLLPETMGGGVAFLDYDNNGTQDLLFINSTSWPDAPAASEHQKPTLSLYRNDGAGHFTDVTQGSGLDVSLYGMGVAVGDYDNDGWTDIFITAVGGNHLFHNLGNGKFAEVTSEAGVAGFPLPSDGRGVRGEGATNWSTGAAWIDYDNDGRLDLFVCNYVRWSREIDLKAGNKIDGVTRTYGPPWNFEGAFPFLYHNDGGGKFTEVSKAAGLQITNAAGQPLGKSLAVAPVDIDSDGWIDLVVANDTVQNFLFRSKHDGTFEELGARSSIAFDEYGAARGAMGIDSARFRNDESLGIAIGNFANQMNALYVQQKDSLVFTDEAIKEGVGAASQSLLKFGLFFFDYDLDGRLDMMTANGHLDEDINKFRKNQQYRQPAQLFWNRGGGKGMSFVPVPPGKCGSDLFKPIVGRGLAFADIDGDGDLDVVMTQINGPPVLLRNDQHLGNHWLRLKLIGAKCNRDAIGAWIRVRVGTQTLSRQVMPTRSYLSQCELPVTIGLGKAARPDSVEIRWPDGSLQKVADAQVDKVSVIRQER